MKPETYDKWYTTPRGQWIAQCEMSLLLNKLDIKRGESLLDVGCGTGFFTRALADELQGPVTGVDVNQEWLTYARLHGDTNQTYELADAQALPYAADSFDLVVSITALCFVAKEQAAVNEMTRVARRRMAIGLLNRRSLLWWRKGRNGGSESYFGARWHTTQEALGLFRNLLVKNVRVRTGVHFSGGGWFARLMERLWPSWLHTGAFMLVVADIV